MYIDVTNIIWILAFGILLGTVVSIELRGRPALRVHDGEPHGDGTVRIRRGNAAHGRSRLTAAAVVIEAVEREDGPGLHDGRGDGIAVRLQLPGETPHGLRGRINDTTEGEQAGGKGADVASHTGAQSAPQRDSPVETRRQRPIAYAVAGDALLFVGDDFARTDIPAAR